MNRTGSTPRLRLFTGSSSEERPLTVNRFVVSAAAGCVTWRTAGCSRAALPAGSARCRHRVPWRA
jgi:hypothetical protein